MLQQISIARHAERPWKFAEAEVSATEKGAGWKVPTGDPHLTAHGLEQAEELSVFLASLPPDQRPQMIVSSPFLRCLETIRPVADKLDLKICVEPGFQEEQWGDHFHRNLALSETLLELHPRIDASYESPFQFKWAHENHDDDKVRLPLSEGVTKEGTAHRARVVWPHFVRHFEATYPTIQHVLIVSHGTPSGYFGRALLGDEYAFQGVQDPRSPLAPFKVYTAGVSKYLRTSGKILGGWTIEPGWECRTDYLSGGAESGWGLKPTLEYVKMPAPPEAQQPVSICSGAP